MSKAPGKRTQRLVTAERTYVISAESGSASVKLLYDADGALHRLVIADTCGNSLGVDMDTLEAIHRLAAEQGRA